MYLIKKILIKILLKESNKSKERLFGVLERPVMMYSCETWPMTQGDEKILTIVR
jgi:hypothetical protein